MCFSPEASFTAAVVTGGIGVVCLVRNSRLAQAPLAALPLLFGAQQAVEGALWLQMPAAPDGPAAHALAIAFLIFAKVLWPVYMPLAVWAAEPGIQRRRLLLVCLLAGAAAALHELREIAMGPVSAEVMHHHIVYWTGRPSGWLVKAAYVVAAGLPLLLSSSRMLNILGAVILAGCLIAYWVYFRAFISVWCFFAAAASIVLLVHVERERRRRPA